MLGVKARARGGAIPGLAPQLRAQRTDPQTPASSDVPPATRLISTCQEQRQARQARGARGGGEAPAEGTSDRVRSAPWNQSHGI